MNRKMVVSVVEFGNEEYFEVLSSGINKFDFEKSYLSTESIQNTKIKSVEKTITFINRPSRANMQPIKNSVWFAKMQNTLKVYAFSEKNADEINRYILSTGFAGIKVNVKKVDLDYLRFFLISSAFNKMKDSQCSGATQKAINNATIKKLKIPIPPLSTQKRIVSILDKAEKLKERRKKANEDLDKLIQSVFYEMFGDPIENRYNFNALGEICNIEIGGTPSRKVKEYFGGENVWVSISDLNDTTIYDSKEHITNLGVKNSNVKLVPKGTILLSFKLSLGKLAIAGCNLYTNEAIASLKIKNPGKINTKFLQYVLKTIDYKSYCSGAVKGLCLNKSILRTIKIPVPPIKLQNQFADFVKNIESLKEKQKKSTEDIEQLFDALMQEAFAK